MRRYKATSSQALRDQVGAALQGLVFQELFEFHTMQSDPNPGNFMYQPDSGRIVLLDLGSTVTFTPEFSANYAGIARALIDRGADVNRVIPGDGTPLIVAASRGIALPLFGRDVGTAGGPV